MYNKNIYDIFEERKFDVFYIENFSFNDLDEIDMVFENIEKYILDDEYIVMEGFKDKIKDIKDNVKEKVEKFIKTLFKLIKDVSQKLYDKYFSVKSRIEKIGIENIIKATEGKKVKKMHRYRQPTYTLSNLGRVASEVFEVLDMKGNDNAMKTRFKLAAIDDTFFHAGEDIINEPLKRENIVNCLGFVINQHNFYKFAEKFGNECNRKLKTYLQSGHSSLDNQLIDILMKGVNSFIHRLYTILSMAINDAIQLINCYKENK